VDDDEPGDVYPDLPPEQLRRLAALDRALDWLGEHQAARSATSDVVIGWARAFDSFLAGG